MPRPSQETQMLEAALHCFVEYGYEGTRIKHIAKQAGVSEGALYAHFTSKEMVAQLLFERYMAVYVNALQQIANETISVQERLQSLIHISLAQYRQNPDALYFILIERPRSIANMPTDYPFPLKIIARVIQEGQAQQVIRDGPPLLLASIFFGCVLRPIIVDRSTHHSDFDLCNDVHAEQIIAWAAWAAVKRSSNEHIVGPIADNG